MNEPGDKVVNKEPTYAFDRDKFKFVVHYICARCRPEELGNVKLHKILYFADMINFMSTGRPLTGVEYQKQQFGPTARHLSWALKELSAEGKLKIDRRDYFGFPKTDYITLKMPDSKILSNEEAQILHDTIDFVCAHSAREISELSHMAPWEAVQLGDVIPYHSAYGMVPAEVTDADVARGVAEARRIRAAFDAECRDAGRV